MLPVLPAVNTDVLTVTSSRFGNNPGLSVTSHCVPQARTAVIPGVVLTVKGTAACPVDKEIATTCGVDPPAGVKVRADGLALIEVCPTSSCEPNPHTATTAARRPKT